MANYEIRYNTGAGDFEFEGSLEDAMAAADDGAAYTQKDIEIIGDNEHYVRYWNGVELDREIDDSENPIEFGSFGYYSDWQET